jgi:hypothetical protein
MTITLEQEVESSAVRKRLWLSNDDGGDDSSDESEEETEEVSLEESSMNQLDTSEEKLMANRSHDLFFSDDGDTSSLESEPRTPEMSSSRMRSDPNGSDNNDDDDYLVIVVSL